MGFRYLTFYETLQREDILKKSFILMRDLLDSVSLMSDDEAGKFFKAIINHVDGNEFDLPRELQFAFIPLKNQLDRDIDKYDKYVKKQQDNGKKGGRPKNPTVNKENPENPTVNCKKEENPNNLVTDTDTVTDIKKDKDYLPPAKKAGDSVPFVKIVNLYHEVLPELSRVEKLTDTRKGYIKQRWKQDLVDIDHWQHYFDYVRQSPFLMGKVASGDRRPFKCTLEWLTKPANYAKVAEDMYHGE